MSLLSNWLANIDSKQIAKSCMFLMLLAIAFFMGRGVATAGASLDFRAAIVGVIAFVIFVAIIAGYRVWPFVFYFWIFTFALGYRTFHVTTSLRIHPAEVIIWFLFLGLLALNMIQRKPSPSPLPAVAWGFALTWLLGIFRALQSGTPMDVIATGLLPVMASVPVFMLVRELVSSPETFRKIGACLTIISFYIALLGALEYYTPSLVAPLRGFFAESLESITQEGFVRAGFSFWGSPVVSLMLVLILPLLFAQWSWWRTMEQRLFLLITIVMTLLAIYIAGYRSVWILVVLEILLYVSLKLNLRWIALALVALTSINALLPAEAVTRLTNLLQLGALSDSSAYDRAQRIEYAWNLFLREPLLGNGWASSGWVHSDWLQIAADLGGIAVILMLSWYGLIFFRLWRVYRSTGQPWVREESVALLTFIVGFTVILATQAVIVLPQLIIPMWLLLALSARLPQLVQPEPGLEIARDKSFGLAADLQ